MIISGMSAGIPRAERQPVDAVSLTGPLPSKWGVSLPLVNTPVQVEIILASAGPEGKCYDTSTYLSPICLCLCFP